MNKKKLTNKGFYAALCACLAVIGAVAYVGGKQSIEEDRERRVSDSVIVAEPTSKPLPYNTLESQKKTEEKAEKKPESKSKTSETKKKAVAETVKQEEKPVSTEVTVETAAENVKTIETDFQRPAEGEIINTFSDGTLVYNKDLDDWRSHDGIDIKSEVGSDVKAVYDGVVSLVVRNVNGKTVKIDHKNGYVSVYSNLDAEVNVQVGAEVKQGDVIGKVGNTTIAEQFMEPHLHFELLENDKYVDPNKFMQ